MEMLKQGQYNPMSLEDQVVVVFSGVRGYLDNIAVEDISSFEKAWLNHIKSSHPEVLKEIKEAGEISDALDSKMAELCSAFANTFATTS